MRLPIACALALFASPAFAQPAAPTPGTVATPSSPPATAASPTVQTTPPAQRSIITKITPSAELCSWLIRVNGALTKEEAPTLDLIRTTTPLQRPTTAGRLEGVYCERDSMVPGEQDDRVPVQLGVPLFINGPTGMTTVSVKDRKFSIAYSRGATITAEQEQAVKNVVLRWEYRASKVSGR